MYASFKFPIQIVKQTNGNVFIFNANTGDYVKSLTAEYVELICNDNGIVKLVQEAGAEYFDPSLVKETQVLPAAPIVFTGNCLDLSQLLATDFFFELGSSGGGCCDLDATLTVGNSAGLNNIDLNNNKLENCSEITASGDLVLNPIGSVNLSNKDLLNVDKATFNLATAETTGIGQLNWNDTDGTLNLGLKGGNVTLQVGQEVVARVVNKTVPLIDLLESNYQVVRVTGATGQRLSVRLAQADTDANSQTTLGIVTENINKNQEGFITVLGVVRSINTTGSLQGETWNDGDVLYLSPTTAGRITNIKPQYPNKIIIVGYVEYAHINNGKIFVNINRQETAAVDIQAACSDETTALTTGTAKVTFRMPYAMTVYEVRASLTTAQTSGSIFTVDINESGTSILSTKLTIDNTEKTSKTAATPAVISDTSLADDAEITVDIDQIGNGTAKGLKITLIGVRS